MANDTADGPQVMVQAIVAWPRKMIVGKRYHIEVSLNLKSKWTYDTDTCLVVTKLDRSGVDSDIMAIGFSPMGVSAPGTTAMRLSRNGSCTSVRYMAAPEAPGRYILFLTMITQGGDPFVQHKLPVLVEPAP